jgi:hypothetical protein
MVGRCSEVLERVAVEPKMIRTLDLKIRSLGSYVRFGFRLCENLHAWKVNRIVFSLFLF